jgi:hypothetical protein
MIDFHPLFRAAMVAAGAFFTMTYFLKQKPEGAAEKAMLLGGVFLVYTILFLHGGSTLLNPRIFG